MEKEFVTYEQALALKELMEYTRKEDRNIKFSTYEEAESVCLDKLIEIIKNK